MRPIRVSISGTLGVILFFGIIFAGLRSGSNDWFKPIYSLTFLTLVYAAIAARYRGPFWYGFTVAGWTYFVIGFGPWINSSLPRAVNRNLVSSVIVEFVSSRMARNDSLAWSIGPTMNWSQIRAANRDGIGHSTLTPLFAFAGGLVARAVASRRTSDQARSSIDPEEP